MTTTFMDAMTSNDTRTENGMKAHSTSGSEVLDFFSKSGALRAGKNLAEGLRLFKRAYSADPLLALKALFYARDIRGGQGERQLFHDCIYWLANEQPEVVVKNIPAIVKYGRWRDLCALTNTNAQDAAVKYWVEALRKRDGLAAKWTPRSGPWFAWLRKAMDMKCGEFRRMVAGMTTVIETQMCNKEWDQINYSHVPSQANVKYLKAFHRNDGERYRKFIEKATKGEVKINSGTLYPSDLVKKTRGNFNDQSVADALWSQLPDFIGGANQRILAMCDVSGSMSGEPMDVSIALGLYVSERLTGAFKDVILTFSAKPTFHKIIGSTLTQRVDNLERAQWDMNTNLELAFRTMLARANENSVSPEEMPTTLLIISDMQFDAAMKTPSANAMSMIRAEYTRYGYELPKVVFWNVRASKGQPAKHNSAGVALVSGYSPSIMKSILSMSPQETPYELMVKTLTKYEDVTL